MLKGMKQARAEKQSKLKTKMNNPSTTRGR